MSRHGDEEQLSSQLHAPGGSSQMRRVPRDIHVRGCGERNEHKERRHQEMIPIYARGSRISCWPGQAVAARSVDNGHASPGTLTFCMVGRTFLSSMPIRLMSYAIRARRRDLASL